MADAKITALSANTTPLTTDILPMVDDPTGTPATQKITIANLISRTTLPAGSVIQWVDALYSSASTGTTTIPADDTIPQKTEGDEYMTLAITPTNSNNKLIIEAGVFGAVNGATNWGMALFQDSTADALAGRFVFQAASGYACVETLYHSKTAGTTSSTTFKIRCGPTGASTFTFNGVGGGSYWGAITKSWMKITEVVV